MVLAFVQAVTVSTNEAQRKKKWKQQSLVAFPKRMLWQLFRQTFPEFCCEAGDVVSSPITDATFWRWLTTKGGLYSNAEIYHPVTRGGDNTKVQFSCLIND